MSLRENCPDKFDDCGIELCRGECPQDGDCSVDTTTTRGTMVTAADRQGTGDRPRDGGTTLTIATSRPECSHSARRLSRCSQTQKALQVRHQLFPIVTIST